MTVPWESCFSSFLMDGDEKFWKPSPVLHYSDWSRYNTPPLERIIDNSIKGKTSVA